MAITVGAYLGRNRPDHRACYLGVCDYLRGYDPGWQIVRSGPSEPNDQSAGEKFSGFDGLITVLPDEQASRSWRASGLPVVNLSTAFEDPHLPQVWSDDAAIGGLAASHLVERGFGQFACFGPPAHTDAARRRDGLISRLRELGFDDSALVVDVGDFSPDVDKGYGQMLVAALEQDPRPIGCLTYTDRAAEMVVHYAKQAGLASPQRVGVVGANNNEYLCETRYPTITSIDPGHRARGYEAGRLIAAMIAGEPVQTPPPVPPGGLIIRGSTGHATTDDPLVDQAIAYIHANAYKPIGVDDVAAHVHSNRVTLGRRFRSRVNTSIHQQIVYEKLEAVKGLLRSTDLDTQGITDAAGFTSRSHLSKLFKAKTGQTLMQYRRRFNRMQA